MRRVTPSLSGRSTRAGAKPAPRSRFFPRDRLPVPGEPFVEEPGPRVRVSGAEGVGPEPQTKGPSCGFVKIFPKAEFPPRRLHEARSRGHVAGHINDPALALNEWTRDRLRVALPFVEERRRVLDPHRRPFVPRPPRKRDDRELKEEDCLLIDEDEARVGDRALVTGGPVRQGAERH